jgi:hypothetical protein
MISHPAARVAPRRRLHPVELEREVKREAIGGLIEVSVQQL